MLLLAVGEIPDPVRTTWQPGPRPRSVQARLERRRGLRLQAEEGYQRRHRPGDVRDEGRAGVDARLPAQRAGRFDHKPMAPWFASKMPDLDFDDIYYYLRPTDEQVDDWDALPERSRTPTRSWASPRPSASTWLASPLSTSPRSSTTATARTSRSQGSCSPTWTPRCASTRRSCVATSARSSRRTTTSSPRSTRRCGRGGSFIYVPPGVKVDMPLQAYFRINAENMGQFERTLIIADEGSAGALRRGLLGPRLLDGLPALGGRRAGRAARQPDHLHDDPELVEQRLQPRHQARPGRGRGARRVDRRQHRLAAHDEVPVGVPDGAQGLGRGALASPTPARASTKTPAPR